MPAKKNVSSQHYNIAQLRVEFWNNLKSESSKLKGCNTGGPDEKALKQNVQNILLELEGVECYFAYPGIYRLRSLNEMLERQEFTALANQLSDITKNLVSDKYRNNAELYDDEDSGVELTDKRELPEGGMKNYFEVLFIEDISAQEESKLRYDLQDLRSSNEQFTYGIVVQRSFEDALIALLFNYNIQAVVIRYAPPYHSKKITSLIKPFIQNILKLDLASTPQSELGPILSKLVKKFRPELDTYYITDTALSKLKDSTLKSFRRIFYRAEDLQELHLTILRGISERYETPFFSALKEYSKKPTGIFHAMPISRGNSVFKSRWINDFGNFYGRNMFLAETSSTTGGLDSLLQPTSSLKKSQKMASNAYGSRHTFFVTNGTSTANKIVVQALVKPGDVILIDRDCHKSHHYGLVLAGAYPVYLDSYPIEEYSMYGAVPLEQIKEKLLKLKDA